MFIIFLNPRSERGIYRNITFPTFPINCLVFFLEAENMGDMIANLNESLKLYDDAAKPAKQAKKAK